jgi:hypothetical protein
MRPAAVPAPAILAVAGASGAAAWGALATSRGPSVFHGVAASRGNGCREAHGASRVGLHAGGGASRSGYAAFCSLGPAPIGRVVATAMGPAETARRADGSYHSVLPIGRATVGELGLLQDLAAELASVVGSRSQLAERVERSAGRLVEDRLHHIGVRRRGRARDDSRRIGGARSAGRAD